ncbi:hypothetical protein VK92_15455 [Burkholderia sp. LK4]|nr:hypothetical protein VL00_05825 [Burkholderia cepacia]KMN59665.1 hypothetical protein VK92_15455 [Burkholderia sp. LK4]
MAATAASAATLALSACGGDSSTPTAPQVQQMNCTALTTAALNLPGLAVTSAQLLPASPANAAGTAQGYPAHCDVVGQINQRTGVDGKSYAIGFDIKMPISGWNGKFFYSGDAGTDGVFFAPLGGLGGGQTTNALSLGYAVASSNGGHNDPTSFDTTFGLDPQARTDYAYNAIGTWTPLAKAIVNKFYGSAPSRSYYVGCSKGGQTGLIAATLDADQFDGIIAGDPGLDLPAAAAEEQYDSQQFLTIPGSGQDGTGAITGAFTQQDLQLVSNAILAKCDALDGATDGMVDDMAACQKTFNFATDVPQCAAGATPNGTCLSAAQKSALSNVFAGARDSAGNLVYDNWPWDPGITGTIPFVGWQPWKFTLNPVLGAMSLGDVFSVPPATPVVTPANSASYLASFNVDNVNNLIYGTSATFPISPMALMFPSDRVHLTALKNHGTKLIVFHGAADPVFSVNHTINWYKNVVAADPNAANYARLFVVPGMNHCGGGVATDNLESFKALVSWVEQGTPPDSILASVSAGNPDVPKSWSVNRTRPICAWPQKAVLKAGATDLESANSFVCQ